MAFSSKMAASMEHEEELEEHDSLAVDEAELDDNVKQHGRNLVSGSYPSVIERYFTACYKTDMNGNVGEDFCILKHSNKVCLLTVAKGHPLLKGDKEIVKVDYNVGAKTNRMENKVSGKRKKGGQWLNQTAHLCKVYCSDDTCYTMFSCINARLIEVNEKLLKDPQLLQTKPSGEGYIAIVLPKLGGCDQQMEKLLTLDQYETVLKARLDTQKEKRVGSQEEKSATVESRSCDTADCMMKVKGDFGS